MSASDFDDELYALRDALLASGQRRFAQARLWALFSVRCPLRAARGDARAALSEALRLFAAQGVIRLPTTTAAWDRSLSPPLPRSIEIPRDVAGEPKQEAWLPQLAFAATVSNASTRDALRCINAYLKNRPDLTPVPLNERSLDIFGDEKRLERLREDQEIVRCGLRLSDIGAYWVPPPLIHEVRAPGYPLMILENLHSYESFRVWNREAGVFSAVVYGTGNAFTAAVAGLPALMASCATTDAFYLGDLDPKGVAILSACRSRCPQIRPHEALYRWLIEHGRRTPLRRIPADPERLFEGWPRQLTSAVLDLWRQGYRVPQESFGLRQLRGDGTASSMEPPRLA